MEDTVENVEPLTPSSRRSFSFSSLRIKRRRHSEEDSFRRRGLWSFSSVPNRRRESSPQSPRHTGEQPRGALIADSSRGEDGGRQGALKRVSAMFSSFRNKGKKEQAKSPEPVDPRGPLEGPSQQQQQRYGSGQYFFEYLVVVSLKKTSEDQQYQPHISYQFPKRDGLGRVQREDEEKVLKAIALFCFPEGISWKPLTEYHSETFSFVLTELDGSRRNGYCRRLLPGGKGARPPEAYCIISRLACFGLFSKIFDEVERRRQVSMAMIYPFMQKLREASFPSPGNTVEISSFVPEAGTEIIRLTRPLDSWLEHVDFSVLFQSLSDEEVLLVFSSAVLERRIIFMADELSTLSQALHAVAALLYPFSWQHTFISIVPRILMDVVCAPTPYLLGVQRGLLGELQDTVDLLVVDLSEEKKQTFPFSIGDEKSILPHKVQAEILESLRGRKDAKTVEELNHLVSETFLHFFVKTLGHYGSYVRYETRGDRGTSGDREAPGVFDRRSFYKAIDSKSTRHFVKKFIQTQMFDLFIQDVEQQQPGPQQGVFHRKILEFNEKRKRDKARKH